MGGKPSSLPPAAEPPASDADIAAAAAAAAAAASAPQQPAAPLTLSVGPSSTRESRAAFDALIEARFGADVRLVGLENYGNTCYANATVQALYACVPFRQAVLRWAETKGARGGKRSSGAKDKDKGADSSASSDGGSLLRDLAALFALMASHRGRSGALGPSEFVARMRATNPQFQGTQHQDAQEFLIFLLNATSDELRAEMDAQWKETEAARIKEAAKTAAKQTPQSHSQPQTQRQSKRGSLSHQSTVTADELRMPPAALVATVDSLPSMLAQVSPSMFQRDPLSPPPLGVAPLSLPSDAAATAPSPLDTPQPSLLLQSILAMQAAQGLPAFPTSPTSAASADGCIASPSHASAASANVAAAAASAAAAAASPCSPSTPTLVQSVFEGTLLNQTSCLLCGHTSSRLEPFFDLSLEVCSESSLTRALGRTFSGEVLAAGDKYSCPSCAGKQEARKTMCLATLPPVLCLHLKRFKFVEALGEFSKLTDRVAFPMQIRLEEHRPAAAGAAAAFPASGSDGGSGDSGRERLYTLTSVVVHIGGSLRHGHYVSLSRVGGQWFCFDDDEVHAWSIEDVQTTFGSKFTGEQNGFLDAYILFYSAVEEDEQ